MNKNMQKIEDEILRLQKLKHASFEMIPEEDQGTFRFLNSVEGLGSYFSPRGKQIDYSIGSLVRCNTPPHVGEDYIEGIRISTVWLGINHSFSRYFDNEEKKPIIFETMIFDERENVPENDLDEYQERYSTLEEAEEGHKKAILFVKEFLGK